MEETWPWYTVVWPFDTAVSACRYAITLTDYYSKWPEVAFSRTATTEDVHFLLSVFSRHGNPGNIVSDNGPQFTSAAFASFLRTQGISHSRTSVYYPAANGAVERFHRALRSCIQNAIQQAQPWNETVMNWLQVYRATPHAATSQPRHMNSFMAGKCAPNWIFFSCRLPCLQPDVSARYAVQRHQNKI